MKGVACSDKPNYPNCFNQTLQPPSAPQRSLFGVTITLLINIVSRHSRWLFSVKKKNDAKSTVHYLHSAKQKTTFSLRTQQSIYQLKNQIFLSTAGRDRSRTKRKSKYTLCSTYDSISSTLQGDRMSNICVQLVVLKNINESKFKDKTHKIH